MRNSEDGTTVRQNSTYTPTHKHEVNLQRNPTLHFQIGLILALLAAIFFIEMRMPEKAVATSNLEMDKEDVFTLGEVRAEPKREIRVKKYVVKPKEISKIIDNPIEASDDSDTVETPFEPTESDDDVSMVDPTSVIFIEEPVEPETVPFIAIEQVPLFPGCEGLYSNDERRDCMSSKISKFVLRKFRTDKGDGLGLEGENQIYVLFKIDTEGNVIDVKARGPHSKLEQEAVRVTELLPEMTPGKQQGRNVNVTMALPIKFIIED